VERQGTTASQDLPLVMVWQASPGKLNVPAAQSTQPADDLA
jgi:hypothetical protein